ncbi:MAG: aldehyde dehydrogenase family protein [Syntrophobacteraceae bacterium]
MLVEKNEKLKTAQQLSESHAGFTVSTCPATGEKIGEFAVNTVKEVEEAIRRAKIAQPLWNQMPLAQRIKHIRKIRDYIMDHLDEIAQTISQDAGKTRVDAMITEVVPACMAISYYCRKARGFLKPHRLRAGNIISYSIGKRSKMFRSPFGVIGIISPWNYPYAIPFSEVIMALLAGNSVVLKAASETQAVGHILKATIEAAELPPDVFTYVNLPGSLAGDAFLDGGVDKLFFTGSVAIGKYLMKKASETLTPVSLELGGNDPMIVCEDADLKRAAAGAVWAGIQNAGQSCGGVERIYVDQKVYSDFMTLLKKMVESLRLGPDRDFNVDIGAVTTRRQMETIRSHIDDAINKGARIFARSQCPLEQKGQFLPAVVLSEVNHDMLVMKDETFGPVLGVMPFNDIDEAIGLANDSYLGLTASIWSRDRKKAVKIARHIQAGAVTINDHLLSHGFAETPWGGFKQSGIGRTHGELGFAEMTEPQCIVNDILPFARKQLFWHPHSKSVYNGSKGISLFLYGRNLFERVNGAYKMLRVMPRMFWSGL